MMYSADYKNIAKNKLGNTWTKGKWATYAVITFIYILLNCALSFIENISEFNNAVYYDYTINISSIISVFVVLFTTGAFTYAFASISLNVVRDKNIKEKNLWCGFSDCYYKSFILSIINSIFAVLWSLLFIIPGIVKALSYSMSYYILVDNKEMTANEARLKSMELMKGHKMDLFCLYFSFIGWFILGAFTLGILYIWIIPYINTTIAVFYQDVSGEIQQPNIDFDNNFDLPEEDNNQGFDK